MSEELPEKVIQLDQIRINRNLDKLCTCKNKKYTIDTQNKRVLCSSCGSEIDAYDAMYDLATKGNRMREQVNQLLEQRKQILDYKPWLVTIRELEKQYRGKEMLPNCPRCSEPFYLEEIDTWTGRQYADARIDMWREENK